MKEELSGIKSKNEAKNRDLEIDNEKLKYEYAKVDTTIENLVEAIKLGRRKEILLLEELEHEEKILRNTKDQGSAYYLFLRGKDPGQTDLEEKLNQEVGKTYDEKLSNILRRNMWLKAEKMKLQDMIDLMKEMGVDPNREKLIARDDVDSFIDSTSILGD
jgi:hypothetical protein